jgi:L,D-peptidoglycan transpeptidase YkuD (ErfK/YbiS/YcfS/YnhG family)
MNFVIEAVPGATRGVARLGDLEFPCALGRSGILDPKREGDGGTPAGRFALRRLLYRADRVARIETRLPASHLEPDDGWCDDPADPAYNRPVKLPYPGRHERMWLDSALYDLVVVIGHNDDPIVPGAGSAVFLHVAGDDWGPTEGCVAFRRDDLLRLLGLLAPGDTVEVRLR